MGLTDDYEALLYDYRKILKEVREAERGEDKGYVVFLDSERNQIHNRLKEAGKRLGKNVQEVNLDIFASEKDLATYGLPEFKVLNTENALKGITHLARFDETEGNQDLKRGEEFLRKYSAFIPFGERDFWHLFDYEGYSLHEPTESERRRRAEFAAKLMEGRAHFIEITSQETFHNAISLYGVALTPDDLELFLTKMRQNRENVSIDKKYFDAEVIREDWQKGIEQDLEYILNREPDKSESRSYLVERLKNFVQEQVIPDDLKRSTEQLFKDAEERAFQIEREIESEKDMEIVDQIEGEYPKETQLPKWEGMRRR